MNTTLNKLREHDPCTDGWKKLLEYLGKTKADAGAAAGAAARADAGAAARDAAWDAAGAALLKRLLEICEENK